MDPLPITLQQQQQAPRTPWITTALRWTYDSTKWMLLFGILGPAFVSTWNSPQALVWGPFLTFLVVGSTTYVACTIISRAQAMSRAAGLLVCLVYLVGPLALGLSLPYEVIRASGQLPIAVGLLIPIGFLGLIWIFLWGTKNLSDAGMRAFVNGAPKVALKYFALAADRSPTDRQQALAQAGVLAGKGHAYKAAQVCALLTSSDPSNVLFWRAKASYDWMAGSFEASDQATTQAIELQPENPTLYFERAVRRARREETRPLALDDVRKALEIEPDRPDCEAILSLLLDPAADVGTLPTENQLFPLPKDGLDSLKLPRL